MNAVLATKHAREINRYFASLKSDRTTVLFPHSGARSNDSNLDREDVHRRGTD